MSWYSGNGLSTNVPSVLVSLFGTHDTLSYKHYMCTLVCPDVQMQYACCGDLASCCMPLHYLYICNPAYFQCRHLMRPTKSKPAGRALSQLASQSRTLADFDYSNVLDNYLYIQALMQKVRKLSFVLWQTHEEWWWVWLPCCSIYPQHCQLTWHCASLLNLICFTKLIMCTSVASRRVH